MKNDFVFPDMPLNDRDVSQALTYEQHVEKIQQVANNFPSLTCDGYLPPGMSINMFSKSISSYIQDMAVYAAPLLLEPTDPETKLDDAIRAALKGLSIEQCYRLFNKAVHLYITQVSPTGHYYMKWREGLTIEPWENQIIPILKNCRFDQWAEHYQPHLLMELYKIKTYRAIYFVLKGYSTVTARRASTLRVSPYRLSLGDPHSFDKKYPDFKAGNFEQHAMPSSSDISDTNAILLLLNTLNFLATDTSLKTLCDHIIQCCQSVHEQSRIEVLCGLRDKIEQIVNSNISTYTTTEPSQSEAYVSRRNDAILYEFSKDHALFANVRDFWVDSNERTHCSSTSTFNPASGPC